MGFVGEPEEINTHVLNVFKQSDMIPVIAPIGFGPEGETFNINADTAAGAIAAAIGAKRFLLLTDVPGVLAETKTLIENINFAEASNLLDEKIIAGGMIPKVTTCLEAIKNGVDAAVILDGRVAHAILLELFTDQGVGTLITLK